MLLGEVFFVRFLSFRVKHIRKFGKAKLTKAKFAKANCAKTNFAKATGAKAKFAKFANS